METHVYAREKYDDFIGDWVLTPRRYSEDFQEIREIDDLTVDVKDLVSALDEELEDANHHSMVGMYHNLKGCMEVAGIEEAKIRKVFLIILDAEGIF